MGRTRWRELSDHARAFNTRLVGTDLALQNVFVPSSASKKAQWLAMLEKQLADIGVNTWCLGSGSRALGINALRLAETITTGIGDGISILNYGPLTGNPAITDWRRLILPQEPVADGRTD